MANSIIHGGDIASASLQFGIEQEQWIDLSTGINPRHYPFADIALTAFTQLPYLDQEFLQAAKAYYGCDELLATSGSQAVIQNLHHFLPDYPLLVPAIGYQEYRYQWQKQARKTLDYPSQDAAKAFAFLCQSLTDNPKQHLVIIQPNNPTGSSFTLKQLQQLAELMAANACLIIDEAFIDAELSASVLSQGVAENMLVLRSFGKFFGLAGVRLGFVFAKPERLQAIAEYLSLWAINGLAQAIAKQAFADKLWQQQAKQAIADDADYTRELFKPLFNKTVIAVHQPLFSSYYLAKEQAQSLYLSLAKQGILVRLIELDERQSMLRVGLAAKRNRQLEMRLDCISC